MEIFKLRRSNGIEIGKDQGNYKKWKLQILPLENFKHILIFLNLLWTIIGYSKTEQMSFENMLNAWVLIKEQEMI